MARLSALAALLTLAVAVSACSSAGHSPTRTAAAAAPAGAKPTRAQALRFAHAVNLTAGDVPGFRTSSRRRRGRVTPAERRLEHQMLNCVGVSGATSSLAEQSSQSFERESSLSELSVSSEVSVSRMRGAATGGVGAINSSHTRACLTHYFNLLFHEKTSSGARFGAVSISQGSPPAPGTSGSFGFRIRTGVSAHGVTIPFYVDVLGFVDGPAEVSLLSSGAPLPFPARAEQELYLLLLQRAKAHRI